MATNSLQSLNYHHHSPLKRHHHHSSTTVDSLPTTLFLKPTTTTPSSCTLLTNITNHPSLTTTFATTSPSISSQQQTTTPTTTFDLLQHHLSTQNFRQADEETRRLLIQLAGEQAEKRGYVFFSEVQFISTTDLQTIDNLWKQHSNNRFGYSIQKKIWNKLANRDFTKFFIKVGWMKLLETEVVQYNYRAFPNEFVWELNEETPEGHLPLTNALRGTQLLNCILNHPAFDSIDDDDDDQESSSSSGNNLKALSSSGNRQYKSDYSF